MDRIFWLGRRMRLLLIGIGASEVTKLAGNTIQKVERIVLWMNGKNKTRCWAKSVVFVVKSPNIGWNNTSHFIRHSAAVKAKGILFTENSFVQFEIVAVDPLSRLHFVINRSLFRQRPLLSCRVERDTKMVKLSLRFKIGKVGFIESFKPGMKLFKKSV